MQITPALLDQALRDALGEPPRAAGAEASLDFIDRDADTPGAWENDHGDLMHAMRLVLWELHGETYMVSNIKEQDVCLLRARWRGEGDRLVAALQGWSRAVAPLLTSARVIDRLQPHDLASLDVLGLRKAKTPEAFATAYAAKSRLGRWTG